MSPLKKHGSTPATDVIPAELATVLTIRVVPESYLGLPAAVAQAFGLRDGVQVEISPWGHTIRLCRHPVPLPRPLTALAGLIKASHPGEQIDFSGYMTKKGYEELDRGPDS
jgi:hypothetical protein